MSKANDYLLVAVDKLGSGLEFVDPSTRKSVKRLAARRREASAPGPSWYTLEHEENI
jgi:hypothetical protein